MQVVITKKRVSGFSLVELMVALGISVLLLTGVVALFVSSRASYETTERLARIQENGRYALEQIASDIRATGFQACARPGMEGTTRAIDYKLNATITPFPPLEEDEDEDEEEENLVDVRWDFARPLRGYNAADGEWEPGLDTDNLPFNPAPSPIGDVLVLRIPKRGVRAVEVTSEQDDGVQAFEVNVFDPMPFKQGDTVMISDCEARAFFQVTSNPETGQIEHAQVGPSSEGGDRPGNVTDNLLHRFLPGSTIVPISTVIYYIAESRIQPEIPDPLNPRPRMSLYRKTGGAELSDEIAEGIERLEVVYGIDSEEALDGRVDSYVSAADVEDWDLVMTAQVALLSRAPDEYGTDIDRQTYVLLSSPEVVQQDPLNDRAQRKVFTATLAVRNQIID